MFPLILKPLRNFLEPVRLLLLCIVHHLVIEPIDDVEHVIDYCSIRICFLQRLTVVRVLVHQISSTWFIKSSSVQQKKCFSYSFFLPFSRYSNSQGSASMIIVQNLCLCSMRNSSATMYRLIVPWPHISSL